MRQVKYSGRLLTLAVLDAKWEVVEHADAVGIIVARGRQVLGVRQKRVAINAITWEVPAGLIDPGETPLAAAHRELAEEAQLGGELSAVTSFYASPGFSTERIYLFEATATHPRAGTPDDDEELTLEWRDALDVWQSIAAGNEVTSSVTVLALRHVLARCGTSV